MKKVVGISFGRRMGNTEVMIKQALLECEKSGFEIQFIRADDLDIHICTGCISCVVGLTSGNGKGNCVIHDDFHIIDEALMECDALIVGSPVYEMEPNGNFKIVCDRIGPSHDITFRKSAYDEGLKAGKNITQLPDKRSFKKRVGALITVGGAMTENWLALSLPSMYAFTMSMGIDIIDTYKYVGAMAYEHVLGNDPVMNRMSSLGKHIVDALSAENETQRTKWRGDQEGVCPVCHCDMLEIKHHGNSVECPVCGIEGKLTLEGGQIKVDFSEEEQKRSRLYWDGKLEHSTEIKTQAVGPGQISDLKLKKEPYLHVGE